LNKYQLKIPKIEIINQENIATLLNIYLIFF